MVILVEILVQNEFNDNIVLFWQLMDMLWFGNCYDYNYMFSFVFELLDSVLIVWIVEIMLGQVVNNFVLCIYVIDFDLDMFGFDDLVLQVKVLLGSIGYSYLLCLFEQGWMWLVFEYFFDGGKFVDIFVVLNGFEGLFSEIWIVCWMCEQ